MSGISSASSIARRCTGEANASLSGFLARPPSACSFWKFGVSSSERRMYQPASPSGTATRNGMRQAQAPKPPPAMASAVSHGDIAKATIVPVNSAANEAICAIDVCSPRLPSGACSARKVIAPAASPPTEKPCSMRSSTIMIGAAMPIAEYGGSRPSPAVATLISMITATSTRCLPIRSPRIPKNTDPSGRTRKETA